VDELADRADVLLRRRRVRDQRRAYPECHRRHAIPIPLQVYRADVGGDVEQVLQDDGVVLAGVLFVQFGVHQFNVVEDAIGVGQYRLHRFRRDYPTRVQRGAHALFLQPFEEFCHERRTAQWFSARNGHAAVEGLVIVLVFQRFFQ